MNTKHGEFLVGTGVWQARLAFSDALMVTVSSPSCHCPEHAGPMSNPAPPYDLCHYPGQGGGHFSCSWKPSFIAGQLPLT
jgi:hypothetical protein